MGTAWLAAPCLHFAAMGHLIDMARTGHADSRVMEQDIRFCELDGRRIAYATVGEGPPLVFACRWVTHLEAEWEDPAIRAFHEELARTHRVVRYDRIGVGLSDRGITAPPTLESEARALATVLDASRAERPVLFACSCGGLATAQFATSEPERVRKIVFFGAYAARDDIPDATRRSLVDFVRTNWPLAAQMLAGLILPHASGDEIAAMSRFKRRAAEADVAAAFLELDLTLDLRALMRKLMMPALVLHRRGDRTVPIRHGRELASLLPNARFVPLRGDSHVPWLEDQRELLRALNGFLHDDMQPESNGDSPLTPRETEVLRLVASGLSNREIASSLVLSEHTVHRHVANVLRKLAQSSRAAAAAQATRAGYI
jgi:pimeloyl-ACP methyl ester carboxylesterase/DNA-binding CsgD family transcriptional regulator